MPGSRQAMGKIFGYVFHEFATGLWFNSGLYIHACGCVPGNAVHSRGPLHHAARVAGDEAVHWIVHVHVP